MTFTLQLRRAIGEDGFIQAQGALHERDERPGPNEVVVPGYATIGVSGGWVFSEHVQLRGTLANLFDKDYPTSPDRRAIGAPGIHGSITLELKLD